MGLIAVKSLSISVWSEVTTEYNEEDLAAMTNVKSLRSWQRPLGNWLPLLPLPVAGAPLMGAAPPAVRQRRQGQCAVVPKFNQQSSTVADV